MKKEYIILFVLCFFIGITNVFASPKCTQPDESWKYKETITKSSSDPGQSMETATEKTVCCELGGNQTKQYYCDVYTKTSEGSSGEDPSGEDPSGEDPSEEEPSGETDDEDLQTNMCHPNRAQEIGENWEFIGCKVYYKGVDYTISSPEKEVPGVEKIVCGVEGGSEAGVGQKWYKCDIYKWNGEQQESPDNATSNGPYVPNCVTGDDWVYKYSQIAINSNISSRNENSVVCCIEGSGQTAGRYTCDVYVKKEFSDNLVSPPKNSGSEDDQQGFKPGDVCEGDECDVNLDNFCGEPTVARTFKFLGLGLFILKILVPAIIIIMGFVNLFKIMTSGKEDDAKKYTKVIVRNVIIGIIIFLAPSLINFVFDLADDVITPSNKSNFSNCVNCILDPMSSSCVVQDD